MRQYLKLWAALVAVLFATVAPARSGQYDIGLSINDIILAQIGPGVIINPPLTTLPQPSLVGMDINPDTVSQSDATEVTSVTDSANSITCTAPGGSGFTIKNAISQANGHNVFRSSTGTKYLDCGRPTNLATPMAGGRTWSVMIVFRNPTQADSGPTGPYAPLFADVTNGMMFTANVNRVQVNTHSPKDGKSYSPGDPSTNIHTYIYSGDAGPSASFAGRHYLDGTMWYGFNPVSQNTNANAHITIGASSDSAATYAPGRAYYGDIVRVIVWTTGISAAEAWQADAYARVTYGKPLATVGLTYFVVFDGDSQTMGTGANSIDSSNAADQAFADFSMPWKAARLNGLVLGQYANVGKPSAATASGALSGYNVTDAAARDVDQFHAVTGLPIVLVWGEFYNEPSSGTAQAAFNRAYCTARKNADPTIAIVTWTSLSSYTRDNAARVLFDNSMVSTPGDCGTVVPVHTDSVIGVAGAAGATNTATLAFKDGIHLSGQTGTSTHAALLAPYIHR